MPKYKLASFEYVPPPPPKFLRDNMQIDDVEGARPKKEKEWTTRDVMKIDDIEGTKAIQRGVLSRTTHYDSFLYKDVYEKIPISKRSVNPLQPEYNFRDTYSGDFTRPKWGEVNEKYGDIKGTKPAGLPAEREGVRNLNTKDVEGAQANTKGLGVFNFHQRRQVRNPITNEDIEGAKTGTVQRGISTKRCLNPLEPSY